MLLQLPLQQSKDVGVAWLQSPSELTGNDTVENALIHASSPNGMGQMSLEAVSRQNDLGVWFELLHLLLDLLQQQRERLAIHPSGLLVDNLHVARQVEPHHLNVRLCEEALAHDQPLRQMFLQGNTVAHDADVGERASQLGFRRTGCKSPGTPLHLPGLCH